ncbi:hypothetical protein [Fictibacillus phosphorivorans]|uniref:hypothetical protein n=1 Tax=Fictibacillus phosphorivorans TaxID=1221500 RepID=UPI00203F7476|nr:hypothetical protein [Fictibacillus phosphorivorans]MCM3719153.1 hypothetical protein [Fictibacillus phosphorivorans]MCM3776775.1 hypothetical protein [Fictibacillus phosphorivorans]
MGNNHNQLQDECIRVQKVYDWVTGALDVRKTVTLTPEQIEAIEEALDDPSRRPLRFVAKVPKTNNEANEACEELYLCEQVGDKRDVTAMLSGGQLTEAQLVELLFTTDVRVQVVDRAGDVVTELMVNASVFESFVLCYPDGTDLYCRITKIFAKIPSGTVLLNSPAPTSIALDITFCIDIQVEAEVKLEVLAKLSAPRENDLSPVEGEGEMCPPVSFPQQCPDIYPRPGCLCGAVGNASGVAVCGEEGATESGRATIFLNLNNYQLAKSSFKLNFRKSAEDEFTFTATEVKQDTLCCDEYNGGHRITVSGRGSVESGEQFDFNLAVVETEEGTLFEVELINSESFSTGTIKADSGRITIQQALQHT